MSFREFAAENLVELSKTDALFDKGMEAIKDDPARCAEFTVNKLQARFLLGIWSQLEKLNSSLRAIRLELENQRLSRK